MTSHDRALLLSLRPRFAEAILIGTKTIELRRRRIRARPGTLVVLYAASPVMAIVGVATLAQIELASPEQLWRSYQQEIGLTRDEHETYLSGIDVACALILSRPLRLIQHISLDNLPTSHNLEPAQSYRYLTPSDERLLQQVAVGA